MRHFHKADWTIPGVVRWLKAQAAKGLNTGTDSPHNLAYLDACTGAHYPTGSQAILSRDTDHHTSGWWKNPDYERCLHLSLSFRDPETGEPCAKDAKLTDEWICAAFGDGRRLIWSEPPFSDLGKKRDVWHYRLFFADEEFTVPILPRGEVYTLEFTKAGWLSFSDLQAQQQKAAEQLAELTQ